MKVFDAPPAEWVEEKAKAEVAKAAAPKPKPEPIGGYDWSKPETYKDPGAQAAQKEQSRLGGVLAGTENPKSIGETGLAAVGSIPFMAGSVPMQMATGALRGGLKAFKTGDDPLYAGLADAATVGAFGGALKAVPHLGLGRLAKPAIAAETAEATKAANSAAGSQIGKDVAWLLPELETFHAKDLWGMSKEWGPAQVKRAFSSSIGPIEERLEQAMNTYRTSKVGITPQLNVPSLSDKPVSLERAIEGLIEAGKDTRGQVRNEILASMRVMDPSGRAGDMFTQTMKLRAAGYTYVNAIAKGLDKSGNFDPEKIAAFINKNADKLSRYAGEYWPALENILLQGRKAPVEVGKSVSAVSAPSGIAKGARAVQKAAESPITKTAVGAGSLAPLGESGTTSGAGLIASTPLGEVIKHIPGGRYLMRGTGIESEGE